MTLTAPPSAAPAAEIVDPPLDAPRSPSGGRPRLRPLVKGVLGAGSIAYLGVYVVLAVMRMRSPLELEWMEGGVVDHVRQVMAGHSLYHPPSLHFVPYIYTPLYYYVSAAVSWLTGGVGFFPLRLVSFLASLATFGAIGALVVTETRDRWAGLVAAGLYAACYRLGGAWFDVARVDSLFLALLFAGLLVARRAKTWRGAALAAAVLTLSFLTKQTALLPALAVIVYLLVRNRRLALVYAGVLAAGIGGSTLVFNLVSGGWYQRYVFDLPAGHAVVPSAYVDFWRHDLWPVGLAAAVGLAGLLLEHRRRGGLRSGVAFHVPVTAGLVASAYSSRLHSGGYDNVLLPAYGAVAVLFGLGVHHLVTRAGPTGVSLRGRRLRFPVWGAAALVGLVGTVQLSSLRYDPSAQLPSSRSGARVRRLIAELRRLPGPVYMPGHGWYLAQAGHETNVQSAALDDVLRGGDAPAKALLGRQLRDAIRQQRFAAVVIDSPERFSYLPRDFRKFYRYDRRITVGPALIEVTGTRSTPSLIYVPRLFTVPRWS